MPIINRLQSTCITVSLKPSSHLKLFKTIQTCLVVLWSLDIQALSLHVNLSTTTTAATTTPAPTTTVTAYRAVGNSTAYQLG